MKIIVPVSGGKDSTACLIKAINEYGLDSVIAVHNNTGWDHPETYKYLQYLSKRLNIEIQNTSFKEAPTIPDLIRLRKTFPFGNGRFCTSELKRTAMFRWFKENGYYSQMTGECWLGIRSDESNQRKRKYGELDSEELHDYKSVYPQAPKILSKNVKLRFPILDWSTEDVFSYLKENGVDKNPLYDEGTNDRVGCYPCLLAGKKVQEKMFATEVGKQRLEIIRQLEREIGKKYEMFDTDQGSCEVCKI